MSQAYTCRCGCGLLTMLASRNRPERGQVKGQPMLYLHGHSRHSKHGMCRRGGCAPEYAVYSAAKQRCTNPKNKDYYLYGGRGIKFLFKNFEQFFAALGVCPKGKSLDRRDNDGDYRPGNVRWATKKQQDANKRKWGTCRKRSQRS